MKRYIRTKDGKIIDTFTAVGFANKSYCLFVETVQTEKQADTIEDLIDYKNDLTTKKYNDYLITDNVIANNDIEKIIELYTKQGNNYILVARKENGEWRVL